MSFDLIPIGVNGLYPTVDSPTSSYLVGFGGKNVLLDMGSGAFSELSRFISPEKIDAIVVSHFHLDHCADLGVFGYYMQSSPRKIKLFCPFDKAAFGLFDLERFYDVETIKEGKLPRERFFGANVEFIRTFHPVETYAVKISFEGKTLSYTADTNYSAACERIFANSSLVIADSAFPDSVWSVDKPHLSAKICGELSLKYGVKTLLTHVAPSTDKAKILEEAFSVSPLCGLIERGKKYTI